MDNWLEKPEKKLDFCHLANYNLVMNNDDRNHLGGIIKQRRITVLLTLKELAAKSGVSSSHLGRIERGERFPSAHILRRVASPLEFEEDELLTLAGYLSPRPASIAEESPGYSGGRLDPYVARVLAREPVDVQYAVIGIVTFLKSIAKSMGRENP